MTTNVAQMEAEKRRLEGALRDLHDALARVDAAHAHWRAFEQVCGRSGMPHAAWRHTDGTRRNELLAEIRAAEVDLGLVMAALWHAGWAAEACTDCGTATAEVFVHTADDGSPGVRPGRVCRYCHREREVLHEEHVKRVLESTQYRWPESLQACERAWRSFNKECVLPIAAAPR